MTADAKNKNTNKQLISELADEKNKNTQLISELADAKKTNTQLIGNLTDNPNKAKQLISELADAKNAHLKLIGHLAGAKNTNAQLIGDLAEAKKSNTQLISELAEAKNKNTQLINDLTAETKNAHLKLISELAEAKNAHLKSINDLTEAKNKNTQLISDMTSTKNAHLKSINDLTEAKNKNTQLISDMTSTKNAHLKSINELAETKNAHLKSINDLTAEAKNKNTQLISELAAAQNKNTQLISELAAAKNINAQLISHIKVDSDDHSLTNIVGLNNAFSINHVTVQSPAIIFAKKVGLFKQLHTVKNVKTIRNIYQTEYVNKHPANGLGDFIRGCFFLLQFCDDYNFQADVYINHPINLFTTKYTTNNELLDINVNNLPVHNIHNLTNFKDSLFDNNNYIMGAIHKPSDVKEFVVLLTTLPTPQNCLNIFTNMFPYREITTHHKLIIKQLFQPNELMCNVIDNTLSTLNLHRAQYSVLHIRLGDKFLIDKQATVPAKISSQLVKNIAQIVSYSNDDLLLICDNNTIKPIICDKFPNIKVLFQKINHFGENVVQSTEQVKNNLTDFYLMANANAIHSFSCYKHGSGFSLWCAKIHDIPYSCKYIC